MTTTRSGLEYDVAVVGAGPAGLAVARLLALKGVSVAVIDPNRVVCQHPRATHIDDETMRMLQALGLADLEEGFLTFGGMEFIDPEGNVFMQLDMPSTLSDQAWMTDYQTHQPDIEARLRGLLHSDDHADLLMGWRVVELTQTDELVDLSLVEKATGAARTITARYVVGADGAGSFVRSRLGIDMEDLDGTQRSLIIDIDPFQTNPLLHDTVGFFKCDVVNPITYLPIFPPYQRFEFMLRDQDESHAFESPEKVYELLNPWHAPGCYRIMRSDVYEWHSSLATRWRSGRVFLAGDAAHLMPPMLGQGMCSGLRDSFNLAWKLALVLNGTSDPTLLETYGSERAPAVRPYIAESARQSNLVESFGLAQNRPPAGPPITVERYRPPLGPGLTSHPGASAGQLTPQGVSLSGGKWDDLVGYNFVVVGDAELVATVTDDTTATWAALGVVVVSEPNAIVDGWLTALNARAAVIRPDRYSYGLASDASSLDAITQQLAGSLRAVAVAR